MSVILSATTFRPEMFGEVIDMPLPTVYVVKTNKGVFTYHDSEIKHFFYV